MKETSYWGNKKVKEYLENTSETIFTMNMLALTKMIRKMAEDSFDGVKQETLTKESLKTI